MSYVRCLRGIASRIEYPADVPMNLDPSDGRADSGPATGDSDTPDHGDATLPSGDAAGSPPEEVSPHPARGCNAAGAPLALVLALVVRRRFSASRR